MVAVVVSESLTASVFRFGLGTEATVFGMAAPMSLIEIDNTINRHKLTCKEFDTTMDSLGRVAEDLDTDDQQKLESEVRNRR